jgi:hypothetical protein
VRVLQGNARVTYSSKFQQKRAAAGITAQPRVLQRLNPRRRSAESGGVR